jgi:hypothetical protein
MKKIPGFKYINLKASINFHPETKSKSLSSNQQFPPKEGEQCFFKKKAAFKRLSPKVLQIFPFLGFHKNNKLNKKIKMKSFFCEFVFSSQILLLFIEMLNQNFQKNKRKKKREKKKKGYSGLSKGNEEAHLDVEVVEVVDSVGVADKEKSFSQF